MTKSEQILLDLLKEKGIDVKRVWFEATFGYLPGGWFAEDSEGYDYRLGYDFTEAKGQIQNNEIIKLED